MVYENEMVCLLQSKLRCHEAGILHPYFVLFPRPKGLCLFATEYRVYFVVAPMQIPWFAELSRFLFSLCFVY